MNDEDQYEPTQEDQDYLNSIEGLIDGKSKPHVVVIIDDSALYGRLEPVMYHPWELETIDGDHLRIDSQPMDADD